MNKKQLESRAYAKPECTIINTEMEQFICVSVSMNASGSTESNWGNEESHEGDHAEWFGTPSDVAPAKGSGLWIEEPED